MQRAILVISLFLISCLWLPAQSEREKGLDAIRVEAVKGQLEFLASDWTQGRFTTEQGAFMASDYIASLFEIYGLKPGGDVEWTTPTRAERMRGVKPEKRRSYFQNISFLEYSPGDRQELLVETANGSEQKTVSFAYKTDFSVSTASTGQEISAPVVFVGYGLVSEKNNYNDFKGANVKGKIILRLTGYPGHTDTTSAAYKIFRPDSAGMEYAQIREKNENAQKYGASAVVEVSMEDNAIARWVANQPFRYNLPWYEGVEEVRPGGAGRLMLSEDTLDAGLSVVTVTRRAANELLRGTGVSLLEFEKDAAVKMKPASKPLAGKSLRLKTSVNSRVVNGRNVIGVLEGESAGDAVVLGAHYDHMGMVKGYIWNGADDNASGTVGVMTIAKACLATGLKPKKTIVFAAWTGEEEGLLGSRYFVQHPYLPIPDILMDMNFDMISRNSDDDSLGNRCSQTYTNAYPELKEITENNNKRYGLGLEVRLRGSERPGGGSDHASFAAKDVPVIGFMAGFHSDYHQPTDDVSKTNWKKMTNIIKLGFLDAWDLATKEGKLAKSPK
jgi:hypothetical protein